MKQRPFSLCDRFRHKYSLPGELNASSSASCGPGSVPTKASRLYAHAEATIEGDTIAREKDVPGNNADSGESKSLRLIEYAPVDRNAEGLAGLE